MNDKSSAFAIFSRLLLGFSGAFLAWQALAQGEHLKAAMAMNGIALLLFAVGVRRPK